jgi:hypothetical protein
MNGGNRMKLRSPGITILIGVTACSPTPLALPDGVRRDFNPPNDVHNNPISSVPPKADPNSDQYSAAFAAGYYAMLPGCDASGLKP